MLRIVAISDTHSLHSNVTVPDGDVLLHAGDFTGSLVHEERQLMHFNEWLGGLPHKHKLCVPGNHDRMPQKEEAKARSILSNATLLIDEEITIDGIRFYGSPWSPEFLHWYFMCKRGAEIRQKWDKIPKGIDVLVTHAPPHGVLDSVDRYSPSAGDYMPEHMGCEELRKAVKRVKPKVHVFGHIHYSSGECTKNGTHYVNAAICTEDYRPLNSPKLIDIG